MANPAIRTMTWVVVAWGGPLRLVDRQEFSPMANDCGITEIPPMDRAYAWARVMVKDKRVQRVKVFCKEFPETGDTFYPGEEGGR